MTNNSKQRRRRRPPRDKNDRWLFLSLRDPSRRSSQSEVKSGTKRHRPHKQALSSIHQSRDQSLLFPAISPPHSPSSVLHILPNRATFSLNTVCSSELRTIISHSRAYNSRPCSFRSLSILQTSFYYKHLLSHYRYFPTDRQTLHPRARPYPRYCQRQPL